MAVLERERAQEKKAGDRDGKKSDKAAYNRRDQIGICVILATFFFGWRCAMEETSTRAVHFVDTVNTSQGPTVLPPLRLKKNEGRSSNLQEITSNDRVDGSALTSIESVTNNGSLFTVAKGFNDHKLELLKYHANHPNRQAISLVRP
eukprot:jgi/Bigna1/126390/aug1.2_g1098